MDNFQGIGERVKNSTNEIRNNVQNSLERVQSSVSDARDKVQTSFNDVRENVQDTIGQFSAPAAVGFDETSAPSTSFLNSNTIIAKFAFFVLVLIVFVLLINLGIFLLNIFLRPSGSPYIVYGMLDGNDGKIVPQDPKNTTSITVTRSNNQKTGVEFTWSVWLNIRSNISPKPYQHIFNKGDANYTKNGTGTAAVNNGPGLYLTQSSTGENTLHVIMDTVDPNLKPQVIDIQGIPYHQWVNVTIRLENKLLDVYVNGIITERATLLAVPKQNYMDINICQNSGFSGNLSNLRYFNYALGASEINSVVVAGPTTSTSSLSALNTSYMSPYFLSASWYPNK